MAITTHERLSVDSLSIADRKIALTTAPQQFETLSKVAAFILWSLGRCYL